MSDFKSGVTAPPFHPNCRSVTVPYLDDEFREIFGEGERAARDENGKTVSVPEDMTYPEWKKVFVDKEMSLEEWKAAKKSVAKSAERGIIKSERNMANGLRTSPLHILTDSEISEIKTAASEIEIPENVLRFNEGTRTGFRDSYKIIYIRGDVLPDINSIHNRDLMSSRAVLAHEYYGHFLNYPSNFPADDWRDEFRASYDAAIKTPNLTDEEKKC